MKICATAATGELVKSVSTTMHIDVKCFFSVASFVLPKITGSYKISGLFNTCVLVSAGISSEYSVR